MIYHYFIRITLLITIATLAGCATPKTATKQAAAEALVYDLEHVNDYAGRIANSLRYQFGLEAAPEFVTIDPREALTIIETMESFDSIPNESADKLRALLKHPDALVYTYILDAPDDLRGLPHSIYLIPTPLEDGEDARAPDEQAGFVIVNMERSSAPSGKISHKPSAPTEAPRIIERKELDELLSKHRKLLLVVGSECGAYTHFKNDSPLAGFEHYHIMYADEGGDDLRELLGPQLLMFPTVVYFEDGVATDAHYGYSRNRRSSLNAFLARHGYHDEPHHYGKITDAYVSEHFPSREAFAQWVVKNKTSLSGLVFDGVDLSGMALYQCSFNGSILRDVNLDGADLRGCDMRCATLIDTDLAKARTDKTTALPTRCAAP